jgi:hypothetical protein
MIPVNASRLHSCHTLTVALLSFQRFKKKTILVAGGIIRND